MAVIRLLLALLLFAPSPPLSTEKTPVYVAASFLDRNRLQVENMSREEIRVSENGTSRVVEFFAGVEVPVAYGLLFDRSLLPKPFEDPSRDQYLTATATTVPSVAYQLIDLCFAGQAGWVASYDHTGMQVTLDFTQDSSRVKNAVQALRGPERSIEESTLYGPLLNSVQKLCQRNEKRRVLVLFIGVLDVKTVDKIRPLKNLLSASNVELFVAGFARKSVSGPGLMSSQSEAGLRELADVTAGGAYFINMEGIERLGRRIADQVRTLYTIGFESESDPGKPAKLTIECTRPGIKLKTHPLSPILQ